MSGSRNRAGCGSAASRGRDHPSASATNDTTSTPAAAAANRVTGIGRSARPTIPCAIRSTRRVYERERPRSRGAVRRFTSPWGLGALGLGGVGRRGGGRRAGVRHVGDADADLVLLGLAAGG